MVFQARDCYYKVVIHSKTHAMPQAKYFGKLLLCLFLFGTPGSSQSQPTASQKEAVDPCRISEFVYTSSSGRRTEGTFEVDKQLRLVKEVNKYFNADGSLNFETVMKNTFDAKGFLVKRTNNSSYTKASKYNATSIMEKFEYEYEKLRMSEAIYGYEDPSRNVTIVTEYEYDADDKVTKKKESRSTGEIQEYLYEAGKLTSVSGLDNELEINDQGLVTKSIDSTGRYSEYFYDADNFQTLRISYNKEGEKEREFESENADSTYNFPTSPTRRKGQPNVPYIYGNRSLPVARTTTYSYDKDGTRTKTYEAIITYDVDDKGNLKSRTLRSEAGKRKTEDVTAYTYVGCQ